MMFFRRSGGAVAHCRGLVEVDDRRFPHGEQQKSVRPSYGPLVNVDSKGIPPSTSKRCWNQEFLESFASPA